MHGLLDNSATWTNNEANQSLAFLLADQGFDVWLGNHRGNEYSLEVLTSSKIADKFRSQRKWHLRKSQITNSDQKGFCDIFGGTFLQLLFRAEIVWNTRL